jgi:Zn-dependent protease with chaperone function
MNFFEHQQRARQRTTVLVLLFALALAAIVAATNLAVLGVAMLFSADPYGALPPFGEWLRAHPRAILWTSLITAGFVAAASLFRMATLASGGEAVARALGGALVEPDARDPLRRQLLNVVEEMAIASGIPAPQVYVLDAEPGINAFAAGFSPADAAIAVTRGALESLSRDELQGVIAHEFSHVLNGDMRLNMRLLGLTFGILVIGLTGRMILRGLSQVRTGGGSGRGDRGAVPAILLAGVALFAIGYIGVLFARLIKAAVSRHREHLADASAVQFTRNPQGLAGALKKIAAWPLRAAISAPEGEEVGHMLIAAHYDLFGALFATHPPILERIRALDPRFDPAELKDIRLAPMTAPPATPAVPLPPEPEGGVLALLPLTVIAAIGRPGEAQLTAAVQRHAAIPAALQEAAHSPQEAIALVLALVMSGDAATRARQLTRIRERVRTPPVPFERLEALAAQVTHLQATLRLPLLEIAFPALRRHPPERLRALIALVDEIQRLDSRLGVIDYALGRLVRAQLGEALAPQAAARAPRPAPKLHSLRLETATLFAALAQTGHEDARAAHAAYDAGMQRLLPMAPPEYAPLPGNWIEALDPALTRLDRLPPLMKRELVEALVLTVSHDRRLTLGEAELLRAVCASLHCPLPPLVPVAT